jgi:uncharacterized RDD family membrane protein YckC
VTGQSAELLPSLTDAQSDDFVANRVGLGVPRAVLRLAGYLESGLLLGVGFLMALSSSHRALHDRLAGISVRRYR